MGTIRRKDKQKAIELRLQGKSYNEIRKILGISSKGTLSYWFRDLKLTPLAQKRLENNMQLARGRGLLEFNRKRTARIKKENEEERAKGFEKIKSLTKRELMLVGTALYWGEGTKWGKYTRTPSLELSNSDPQLIYLFMRFVREILQVPDEKIRAGIHLYESINNEEAKVYWSKVTGLPVDRFYIVQQISRASKRKRKFNKLPFGTAVIKVNNRLVFYQVKGMVDGLIDKAE